MTHDAKDNLPNLPVADANEKRIGISPPAADGGAGRVGADSSDSYEDYAAEDFPSVSQAALTDEEGRLRVRADAAVNQPVVLGERESPRGRQNSALQIRPKKKKRSLLGHIWDFGIELAKVVVIVLLLRAYVIQASKVEGHSMEPTLFDGDLLLVERVSASFTNAPDWLAAVIPTGVRPAIERGDIVVLSSPENGNAELVKRVVAVGGDRLFFYDGGVWVNGERVEEEYLKLNGSAHYSGADFPGGMTSDYRPDDEVFESAKTENRLANLGAKVPDECFFVMGDNRAPTSSNDSRSWSGIHLPSSPKEFGGLNHLWVTKRDIHGRVLARLLPPWKYDETRPVFPK